MLEAVLLATVVPAVWVTGLLVTARLYYQKARPSKKLLCGIEEGQQVNGYSHEHRHLQPFSEPGCYRRYSDVDTDGEAVFQAVFLGAFWPVVGLYLGARAAIMAGAPEFPEEKAARMKSLDERIGALEKEWRDSA